MKKLPDGWKKVDLSEILESIENGNRPKGGITDLKDGIPSIGGEHINSTGGFNLKNVRLIPYDFYSSMSRGKIQKEDVLVVKDGATTGKVSLVDGDFPYEDAAVNEHVFILRGKKYLVDQKFLFYHLYSPIGQRQMDANFHGAAIGGINTQFVKNYNLVLPPLPTQKKIAAVLEKAEKLREWRKEADGLTDKFLKSTFLEMFGDIGKNENGWNEKSLKNCIEIPLNSGLSPICSDVIGGIPVFSLANLTDHGLINNMTKYYYGDQLNKGFDLEIGDILISRSNTKELVGRVGLYKGIPEEVIYPDLMIRIRLDREVLNPIFFEEYLRTDIMRESIQQFAHGTSGSMVKISQKNLMDLQLTIPPIELQQKFASIVQQIEQVRQYQKESKQQIDHFFNVLMQKAFNGELEA